jgi:hypothetical protein
LRRHPEHFPLAAHEVQAGGSRPGAQSCERFSAHAVRALINMRRSATAISAAPINRAQHHRDSDQERSD